MAEGLPANTNPFVVLISWNSEDVRLHETAPEYFSYDTASEMPIAKEVIKPPLTQEEAERLVRQLVKKNENIPFAVHEKFFHIIPKDLKSAIRAAKPFSGSHGKRGFYIPCCTDMECYYLK